MRKFKSMLLALSLATAAFEVRAQVSAVPLTSPHVQFLSSTGQPLAGGKVYCYLAGTTAPQACYSDSAATVPQSNPVILDASGSANIWFGTGAYKLVVTDANGVQQWTADNLPGGALKGFRGAWSNTTAYNLGDTVAFNGGVYVAVTANTNVQPGTDITKWVVLGGPQGPVGATGPQGATGAQGTPGAFAVAPAWSASQTYNSGDTVIYSGLFYESLVGGNLNHQPSSSPSQWIQVSIARFADSFCGLKGDGSDESAALQACVQSNTQVTFPKWLGAIHSSYPLQITGKVNLDWIGQNHGEQTYSQLMFDLPMPAGTMTRSSNVATYAATSAHHAFVNEDISVYGCADSTFNGHYIVTGVPDTTHFTVANTGSTVGTPVTGCQMSGGTAVYIAGTRDSTFGGFSIGCSNGCNAIVDMDGNQDAGGPNGGQPIDYGQITSNDKLHDLYAIFGSMNSAHPTDVHLYRHGRGSRQNQENMEDENLYGYCPAGFSIPAAQANGTGWEMGFGGPKVNVSLHGRNSFTGCGVAVHIISGEAVNVSGVLTDDTWTDLKIDGGNQVTVDGWRSEFSRQPVWITGITTSITLKHYEPASVQCDGTSCGPFAYPLKLSGAMYRVALAPRSGEVKVHLGPGQRHYIAGWYNVDANFLSAKIDIWADLRNPLPFRNGTVDAFYSHHMIEHLPDDILQSHFDEMFRCLKPGGVIRVGGPNADSAARMLVEGNANWFWEFPRKRASVGGRFANFLLCAGEHLTLLTRSYLEELSSTAGFKNVMVCAPQKTAHPQQFTPLVLEQEYESTPDAPHTLLIEAEKPEPHTREIIGNGAANLITRRE